MVTLPLSVLSAGIALSNPNPFQTWPGSGVVVTDIAGARFVSRYHPRIVEQYALQSD